MRLILVIHPRVDQTQNALKKITLVLVLVYRAILEIRILDVALNALQTMIVPQIRPALTTNVLTLAKELVE